MIDQLGNELDPMIVPCTCSEPWHLTDHKHGCARGVAHKHEGALYVDHGRFAMLYPGTLCEWPKDGPGRGTGRGYGEPFICMHCGQGHGPHGVGHSYIEVQRFKHPEDRRHQICKIFIEKKPGEIPSVGGAISLDEHERKLIIDCLHLTMKIYAELELPHTFEAVQRMTALIERLKP